MRNPFRYFSGRTEILTLMVVGIMAMVVSVLDLFALSPSFVPFEKLNLLVLSMLAINVALNRVTLAESKVITHRAAPQSLDSRLQELTNALTEAGGVISAIEVEIQSRQDLVGQLEQQRAIAERAIELSKEQVDAVAAILSEQVSKQSVIESRRDYLREGLFFLAGIAATLLLSHLGWLP